MQRLKKIIDQYGRWKNLSLYVDRIEAFIESDFSIVIENSKALLESISKEICSQKNIKIKGDINTSKLVKEAFKGVGYHNTSSALKVSTALGTIAKEFSEIRNTIGTTSHGKTLQEIEKRNDTIDELSKDLLIESTIMISSFLIRSFENFNPRKHPRDMIDQSIEYIDNQEFNEFWDELYGEYQMGDYSYTASEILYNVDKITYVAERAHFRGEQND